MTPKRAFCRNGLATALFAAACWTAAAQQASPSAAPIKTSATERAAIEAAFARADTNGDGKLSREEASTLR